MPGHVDRAPARRGIYALTRRVGSLLPLLLVALAEAAAAQPRPEDFPPLGARVRILTQSPAMRRETVTGELVEVRRDSAFVRLPEETLSCNPKLVERTLAMGLPADIDPRCALAQGPELRVEGARLAVDVDEVIRIDSSRGPTRGGGIRRGLLYGGLGGAAVGGAAGVLICESSCSDGFAAVRWGATRGALLGLPVGALVGALLRGEAWQTAWDAIAPLALVPCGPGGTRVCAMAGFGTRF